MPIARIQSNDQRKTVKRLKFVKYLTAISATFVDTSVNKAMPAWKPVQIVPTFNHFGCEGDKTGPGDRWLSGESLLFDGGIDRTFE
jgi:hypothetical protein